MILQLLWPQSMLLWKPSCCSWFKLAAAFGSPPLSSGTNSTMIPSSSKLVGKGDFVALICLLHSMTFPGREQRSTAKAQHSTAQHSTAQHSIRGMTCPPDSLSNSTYACHRTTRACLRSVPCKHCVLCLQHNCSGA